MEYFVVIDQIQKEILGIEKSLEDCAKLYLDYSPRMASYLTRLGRQNKFESAEAYLVSHFQDDLNNPAQVLLPTRAVPVTVWRYIKND